MLDVTFCMACGNMLDRARCRCYHQGSGSALALDRQIIVEALYVNPGLENGWNGGMDYGMD